MCCVVDGILIAVYAALVRSDVVVLIHSTVIMTYGRVRFYYRRRSRSVGRV